ncbi:MAG TPA: molybdenum cofactor guanylyltransferase [Anditalea sp.]|nr:molybdenum cofactor guanylyltransferase [Anditalea sp.]
MEFSIAAYILAGGKSSRMGKDKGLISLNDKPMVSYTLNLCKEIGYSPILVASQEEYSALGYPVIKDIIPDKGPMGGLYTALEHNKDEATYILLFSCDMPFIPKEAIFKLAEAANDQPIIVSEFMNEINPLFALYHKDLREQVKLSLEKGHLKMKGLIETFSHDKIDMEDLVLQTPLRFSNINTPEDLEKSRKLWEK